jgi:hypothetical protein
MKSGVVLVYTKPYTYINKYSFALSLVTTTHDPLSTKGKRLFRLLACLRSEMDLWLTGISIARAGSVGISPSFNSTCRR